MAVMTGAWADDLTRCAVLFEAADPPRAGTVVFWDPPGGEPGLAAGQAGRTDTVDVVTVEDGTPATRTVAALRLSVADALAVL
ncbi:hypothetical protein AB0I98_47685, partial [Streptomyces sp. NPDC050211]|uniref:hypothetical protein n=1 Tax=Streptomyces sp. NPDC050211 TaxID=3154932 RepID=UPI0034326A0F